jgi:hypothetical protein
MILLVDAAYWPVIAVMRLRNFELRNESVAW